MTGFSNQCITPKVPGKPHIVFIDGYWRVSPCPRRGTGPWYPAHAWVRNMNQYLDYRRWAGLTPVLDFFPNGNPQKRRLKIR